MAVLETKIFKQEDLVLKVTDSYDPFKLPVVDWEEFLDALCNNRKYQKEAITKAVVYLGSGKYDSLQALAEENFGKNPYLQDKYRSFDEFKAVLQIPNKLYGTIDLATGTGKSYVIYGIAQMMLGLGIVDRVLVLCPSITIETELTDKFKQLCADANLRKLIPDKAVIKNPRVINADSSVMNGDICIENIHAVYENTGSSIKDSFIGTGERVLVLNDEAHHIFNKITNRADDDVKKWKDFLCGAEYNFKYILGFTGTAYIEDDYFADVIYRYSLRHAIDEKVVKNIDYVREDDSTDQDEKFEKIYSNHVENKKIYALIKPITILVTRDINEAEKLRNQFMDFLTRKEKIKLEDAENKVLIVTSALKHKKYLPLLRTIDEKSNSYEWVVSVSMLTEGWDVKNVFRLSQWKKGLLIQNCLWLKYLGEVYEFLMHIILRNRRLLFSIINHGVLR